MRIAYLDCFSGLSGDMFLGAMLDAGLSLEELRQRLGTLPLKGYSLTSSRQGRNQIFGTRFEVAVDGHEHAHRNLDRIRQIIHQGRLSEPVKQKSISIFEDLARVEGKIHDLPPEKVHFHEVGAVDSIVDIVGGVYGLERLEIEALHVSSLPLGSGFTNSAHGRLPLPAPATLALLEGLPVYDAGVRSEMVTPTGAALVRNLARSFGEMPPLTVDRIGYGVGSRDLSDRPNLLRMVIGTDRSQSTGDTVIVLESNIDDMNPEWLGYLMDRLFEAGALDAVFCPVQMKKNRPGIQIQVVGPPERKDELLSVLFAESTTLGIRYRYSQRRILKREMVEVDSPWGKMRVKKSRRENGTSLFLPEYEICRRIATEHKQPLKEIFYWVMALNGEPSSPEKC